MTNRVYGRLPVGLLGFMLGLSLSMPGWADEQAGAELAQQVYDRPEGNDAVTRGRMVLGGEGRRERVRESYEYRLEGEEDESWNLIRFTSPSNIADTGLLVHNRPEGASDQWLFLPAAQRVRRISSENRGGSFVQSELWFEDLEDREPHKDSHRLLGEDSYEGTEVKLLESVPVDAGNSVYSKRLSWVHPDTHIPLRIDFYQDGDEPVKRLTVERIERIQGYWTVMSSTMTDLRQGRTTRLEVEEVVYDQGLPRDLFTSRALSDPSRETDYRP